MTVAELIEQLNNYPPTMEVLAVGCDGYDCEEELNDAWIEDDQYRKSILHDKVANGKLVIRV